MNEWRVITGTEAEAILNRIDGRWHGLTEVAALCPVCMGRKRVPRSGYIDAAEITKDWPMRDCSFCLALIAENLVSCGVVHRRRLQQWENAA